MDIRYLQSFVVVAECGSLAEAARRLDLTPAALAARIRALETQLDTVLVSRSGRTVKPTEAGLKILERARSLVRDVRDLHAVAANRIPLGELRLGVFFSALTSLLPPVLQRVYAVHPELVIHIGTGASIELCRQVGSGELDAALVVEPQFVIAKTCKFHILMEEPLIVVAPAALADRDAHSLLRVEPFIRYDRTVLGGQLADRYLRDHGLRPRQRLEINSVLAIAALIDRGLGVSLLPDWSSLWTEGWSLARIPLPDRPPVRRVGLVWDAHGPRAVMAEAVLQAAIAVFGRPNQFATIAEP